MKWFRATFLSPTRGRRGRKDYWRRPRWEVGPPLRATHWKIYHLQSHSLWKTHHINISNKRNKIYPYQIHKWISEVNAIDDKKQVDEPHIHRHLAQHTNRQQQMPIAYWLKQSKKGQYHRWCIIINIKANAFSWLDTFLSKEHLVVGIIVSISFQIFPYILY